VCLLSARPSIQNQPSTIYVRAGGAALFPCHFTGIPTPSVYWTVIHSDLSINVTQGNPKSFGVGVGEENFLQHLTVYQNGSLAISRVVTSDSTGQYHCTAVNRLGVAKGAVELKVVGGRIGFCCVLIDPRGTKFEIMRGWVAVTFGQQKYVSN